MKQGIPRFMQKTLKHVKETYGFLFERGYDVFSAENIPMGWQVVLRKQDLFVKIDEMREEEEISFRMGTQPPDEFTDMGSVIYAATGDRIPRWESSDPKVLAQYLDRIETYLEGAYVENKDGLRAAQEEYFAAFSHGETAFTYGETPFAPEEVVMHPEPKVIPILYYPLLGIILLLLFGALTTLYMVLLDRLFSTLSLDPDFYGIFMGVISPLLAIGTILLFRGRRKRS